MGERDGVIKGFILVRCPECGAEYEIMVEKFSGSYCPECQCVDVVLLESYSKLVRT